MSSKEVPVRSREDVLLARESKKLAKPKTKNKGESDACPSKKETESPTPHKVQPEEVKNKNAIVKGAQNIPNTTKKNDVKTSTSPNSNTKSETQAINSAQNVNTAKDKTTSTQINEKSISKNEESPKCEDEVDRAVVTTKSVTEEAAAKTKEQIKAERAAKKAAKQAKKKGVTEGGDGAVEKDITVKDVVETLNDIVNVAKEVQEVTAKLNSIDLESKKPEEVGKSKAELRAERRAKQEAQRAAKQAASQQKTSPKSQTEPQAHCSGVSKVKEEKSPKSKAVDKAKSKSHDEHRVNWFQHLYNTQDKEALENTAINSNLHPAIIKLGVQLSSRVVTGANARCIALLDALKKMVSDYSLPAKTEFARGLEAHLAASLEYLWAMRQPTASQTNAIKYFRHHLNRLPNNVDEFDAKKTLQEDIDRYIREQIEMAGEAISIAVRQKISEGDNILTYGCSSLIERILCDAWAAGVRYRAVVAGARVGGGSGARDTLRRLSARGVPCTYVDITGLSFIMPTVNKVLLGCVSLLVNGCVVGAVGTAQTALVARECNVPVLVACETHKFSERVHTDAFVYNEIGDPDELIDKSDENSPLKDWRSNPNLTPLNLMYDVTPPRLVTAVVTELAILPCTSAPVVLRFKLSEYGV